MNYWDISLYLTNLSLTTLNLLVKRKIKEVYFCLIVTKKLFPHKSFVERDFPVGNIFIPPLSPFSFLLSSHICCWGKSWKRYNFHIVVTAASKAPISKSIKPQSMAEWASCCSWKWIQTQSKGFLIFVFAQFCCCWKFTHIVLEFHCFRT